MTSLEARSHSPRSRATACSCLALTMALALDSPLAAADGYSAELAFHKLPAAIEAMPIVLTGQDFFELTGASPPPVDSIRLSTASGTLVHQVDHRDKHGRLAEPDETLDPWDELVFFLDAVADEQVRVEIAWGGPPAEPPGEAKPEAPEIGVKITPEQKLSYVEMWAETPVFRVGLNAEGLEDTKAHNIANYGRAAFAVVEANGTPLTAITSAWNNFLPNHPFGSGEGPHRWRELQVAKAGPVRTLITTECPEFERGVYAEFAFYNRGPAIDLRYILRYHRYASDRLPEGRGFGYPLRLGAKGGPEDVLLVPVAGRVHRQAIKQQDIDGFYPTLYETPLPEEGWFAWVDTAEKSGLAVFYEKLKPIRARAAWVDSRPPCNPRVRIRVPPYGRPENAVSWQHRSVHTAESWTCCNRFLAIADDNADYVHTAYYLWGKPIHELGGISPAQPR